MLRKNTRASIWACALWFAWAAWAGDVPAAPTGDAGTAGSACHQAFSSKPQNVAGALLLRNLSEQELIARSRDGDKEAAGALYENYRVRIKKWAKRSKVSFKYGDQEQAADDLTGQVSEKLIEEVERGTFFPRGDAEKFEAWLFKMADHAAIDANRRAAVEAKVLREYTEETKRQAVLQASPDPFRDSVNNIVESDDIVETLKPSLRGVYLLVMRRGYSQVEAAKRLRLAKGTVNAYVSEVKKTLAARYSAERAMRD